MPDWNQWYELWARRQLRADGARSIKLRRNRDVVHVLDARGQVDVPPLVLLHGFSASAATQYHGLVRQLLPYVGRVLAPDLPGHGGSSVPADGITTERLLGGLFDALNTLLDRPAVIFGSSMGGAVAIRYAARHPERVRGLILCSPAGAPVAKGELLPFLSQFRLRNRDDAKGFVDRLFAYPPRWRRLYAWGVRNQFARPVVQELLHQLGPADFLSAQEVASLSMPVLLIWGRQERILPASQLRFFREHLPKTALIEEPDGFGHAPFLERPMAVAQRIITFTHRLEAAPLPNVVPMPRRSSA